MFLYHLNLGWGYPLETILVHVLAIKIHYLDYLCILEILVGNYIFQQSVNVIFILFQKFLDNSPWFLWGAKEEASTIYNRHG